MRLKHEQRVRGWQHGLGPTEVDRSWRALMNDVFMITTEVSLGGTAGLTKSLFLGYAIERLDCIK